MKRLCLGGTLMIKKNKKFIASILSVLVISTIALSGCKSQSVQSDKPTLAAQSAQATQPVEKKQVVLGTICTVKLYDHIKDSTFEKAFKRLSEIEEKMSINTENSEIVRVNSAAGKDYVQVSPDTLEVIKQGLHFSELYNKFDITIGPIVKLWNISFDNAANARIPSSKEISEKLPLVNYKNVLINDSERKVMLKEEGMMLDLGGIAKGYAADEVVKILKENGVEHAIVNLGGNVLTLGAKPDGSAWTVGVQHPFSNRGDYVGAVKVAGKTVVTSGIYERYIEKDGKIYHHIIDKATGYPVDNNLLSATIITDKSVDGDGLSKVFALGVEAGLQYVKGLKGVDAIFITKDNKIYITPGLKNTFQLTDKSFQLIQ
jgi:thiamine biosynthesis lipoprotein